MSTSLIYRSAVGYELVMRALYGRHYADRLRAVAECIPAGASVLELCCGPGMLYRRHLRGRVGAYAALDANPRFVERCRRAGADARLLNLATSRDPFPAADVVIMQASLYHFLPAADAILERMLTAARERVVIAEPIRNLTTSDVPLAALIGRRATDPGVGGHDQRFTEQTLDELMSIHRERVIECFEIPGGREKVYVLAART